MSNLPFRQSSVNSTKHIIDYTSMNIDQANQFPIAKYLASKGIEPAKRVHGGYLYHSPLRVDNNPSLKVSDDPNRAYDYALDQWYDCVNIATHFEGSVPHALAEIARLSGGQGFMFDVKPSGFKTVANEKKKDSTATKIIKVKEIKHRALVDYLSERCIPVELARAYLKEVYYYVASKDRDYFGLGFPSGDGYVTRNPMMAGFVGQNKQISILKGRDTVHGAHGRRVVVFEGFFDFLSGLVIERLSEFAEDVIILHSVSMVKHALRHIEDNGYGEVKLYLDNDEAGNRATGRFQELAAQGKRKVVDCRKTYQGYNDLNAYLCDTHTMMKG